MASAIGQNRLEALRSWTEELGTGNLGIGDNDVAAVCLLRVGASPSQFGAPVTSVATTYKVAPGGTSGLFKSGQNADILLSGIDFNTTGGPLLFNHPGGIASDGTRLYLADTFNNRVLAWNNLPKGNVPPDLVLGQPDFNSNNPGMGRDQLDWPRGVATDGKRLLVADTDNYRILIWNSIPTTSGQPADIVLQGGSYDGGPGPSKTVFWWPWGVWTNGEKVVITSTQGSAILIWNQFPTRDNQPADILLTGGGMLGTPRDITSDGKSLIVGDHNAKVPGEPEAGSFFWKTFPTRDDQPYDFYMSFGGPWLRGAFGQEGRLILIDTALRVWNTFPQDATAKPDLAIDINRFLRGGGDYESAALVGSTLYISAGNANKILVYNSIPTRADQVPDFAVGSPDIKTNTLNTEFIISNPFPNSNGKSLFVSSDVDRKLYVWKELPDQSGAHPDLSYSLDFGPVSNALWRNTFALVGTNRVLIWNELPVSGKPPDLAIKNTIGSVQLNGLTSVAMDDNYFYLADLGANKVYVWKGLPSPASEPALVLNVESPLRLSSDGTYLVVATYWSNKALVYPVAGLTATTKPATIGGAGAFNGLLTAAVAQGHLFIADAGFNRVHIWNSIQDALAGKAADAVLGANFHRVRSEIGRYTLFLPATVSFDGSYLWVGETKFSMRLLRFSPSP